MKKKKKLERKRRGREIKRSIVKPSRRVLAFYCSAAGDGGSQQAAWWEASIKVSGRLIVIQSGGRLRYQFPVRPRSFPLRVFPLFAFFSLSLSLAISLPLSLSSLLLRSARSDRVSIALRLLVPSSNNFSWSLLEGKKKEEEDKKEEQEEKRSKKRRDKRRRSRFSAKRTLRACLCVSTASTRTEGFFGGEREVASRLGNTRDR